MFKEIIVATDGSEHAARASEAAADIAAKYSAKLTIVTVLPASLTLEQLESRPQVGRFEKAVKDDINRFQTALEASAGSFSGPSPLVRVPAPYSAIAALGEEILNDAESVARKKGVAKIERVALNGHPAEEIVRIAKKSNANLIVIGARGLSNLEGLFMGSISNKVIHMADCPCLIIK